MPNLASRRNPLGCVLNVDFQRGSAADRSPFARTPTVLNSPTFSSRAVILNGSSQYITYPSATELNLHPLTATAWFNLNGADQSNFASIFEKHGTLSWNGWQLHFNTSEQLWSWYFTNNASTNWIYNSGGNWTSPSSYKTAGWNHVCVVYQTSGGTMYVNGASVATKAWSGSTNQASSTRDLHVGYHNTGAGVWLNGRLSGLKIFNRAFTAADVLALYAAGREAA